MAPYWIGMIIFSASALIRPHEARGKACEPVTLIPAQSPAVAYLATDMAMTVVLLGNHDYPKTSAKVEIRTVEVVYQKGWAQPANGSNRSRGPPPD